tara:strand:+ start:10032 stop:10529 length:498 start_codon:yes stop_codon:yes gene_type:complete
MWRVYSMARASVLEQSSGDYGKVFETLNIKNVTADTTLTASDSGKTIIVNPAAETTITLPDVGLVGWTCRIILDEDEAGTDAGMDAVVNVDLGSGSNLANVGQIYEIAGGAGDAAVANDDFVVFTAAASPGDTVEIFGNGKRWFVYGYVKDLTDGAFSTNATTIA